MAGRDGQRRVRGFASRKGAALALLICVVGLSLLGGCRRRRAGGASRKPAPRGPIVVVGSDGARDPAGAALASAIDAQLGGTCPRALRLARRGGRAVGAEALDDADARALAEPCVDAALLHAGVAPTRAEPWRSALAALVRLRPDDPRARHLRAIAREVVARGGGPRTLALGGDDEGAAPPDPRATAAVAFGFLEALAARPGVGAEGALRFTLDASRRGVERALEAPPIRLDGQTLLSHARAELLARPAGSGPKLLAVRWDGEAGRLVAKYDRPLLAWSSVEPRAVDARACGAAVQGLSGGAPDELAFPLDLAACARVDGVTVATLSVGEAPWGAPASAVDGALAKPAHARVELP